MAEKEPDKEAPKEKKVEEKKIETASPAVASSLPKKPAAHPGEKIFNISLRKAFRKSTKNKRAPYAITLVQAFLKRHLKCSEVKIGEKLNQNIWECGNNIPRKVRVTTFKDGDIVKAELMGFEYQDFKAMPKKEKKGMKDKLLDRLGPKAAQKQKEEEMIKGEKTPEKREKMEKHEITEE